MIPGARQELGSLTESDTPSRYISRMFTRRSFFGLIPLAPQFLRRLFENRGRRGALLFTTSIAGYRFHDGPGVEHRLREGDSLALRREPDNPHDPLALAVIYQGGTRLGYVPRRLNEVPARLIDQGVALSADIARIRGEPAAPWERLTIAIRL